MKKYKMFVCLGSINIDHVFQVPHITKPGETLSSTSYTTHYGGKGANQSISLSRAGCKVTHIGAIGKDGLNILDYLTSNNINTTNITILPNEPTGTAFIQSTNNNNAIVLLGGANLVIPTSVISTIDKECVLVLQNEINFNVAMSAAESVKKSGGRVVVNFAPAFTESENAVRLLQCAEVAMFNEEEAIAIVGRESKCDWMNVARDIMSKGSIRLKVVLITLGESGSMALTRDECVVVNAITTKVIDTTGAGDVFIGYFLKEYYSGDGESVDYALRVATCASSIQCERVGAMEVIPEYSIVKERYVREYGQ